MWQNLSATFFDNKIDFFLSECEEKTDDERTDKVTIELHNGYGNPRMTSKCVCVYIIWVGIAKQQIACSCKRALE